MQNKVSVIIPVYNVERYIDKCVESVVNQTYKNLEIILVNDGSKDNSYKKCLEWAEKDSRVIAFTKENSGPADTRNIGIDKATGKWILFVDSDDWYESDTHIEKLIKCAYENDADMVCFTYKRYYENSGTFSRPEFNGKVPGNTDKKYLVDNKIFTSSPCTKLISTDIFRENDIYFESGILSEDVEFNLKLLIASKICAIAIIPFIFTEHAAIQ